MLKKCALIAALLLVAGPASARADWLFIPNIGAGFGGDLPSNSKLTYGADIVYMGGGVLGFEADLAWTPSFLESNTIDNNTNLNVDFAGSDTASAVMGNVIVGLPFGGTSGAGIRPYFVTGFGLMRAVVQDDAQLFDLSQNDWGWDIGGGAMGFFSQHFGLRGDIRYYRDLQSNTTDILLLNDTLVTSSNNFSYWRGTGGVAFRW